MAEEIAAVTAAPPRNDNGVARIKPEYRLERSDDPNSLQSDAANDDTAEESGKSLKRTTRDDGTEVLADDAHGEERGDKRTRGNDSKRGKAKGMNKGRKFSKIFGSVEICQNWAATQTCHYGESCRKGHDLKAYLDSKPADMHFPQPNSYSVDPPFVLPPAETDPILCPTFEELGFCPQGFKCRYLAGHLTKPTSGKEDDVGTIVIDYEKKERLEKETGASKGELNWVNQDAQRRLKENSYEFKIADAYLKKINGEAPVRKAPKKQAGAPAMSAEDEEMEAMMAESRTDADKDIPDGPMRPEEKRRLHWKGKTYLAPLTTTGNLPFRRLCVSLGADITCSEMGLAEGFLKGTKGEWALTKRHTSERDFGIQVAGSKPVQLVPTAEAIARECPSIDFVDVNLGCPIDLVFNKGAGSALFDSPTKLGKILVGMSHALGEIPLTVKMRTGIKNNLKQAHTLIPRFATEWGANAMTLHGRSRQQRYSKSADWNYIRECADTLRATVEEANLPMIPIFGNGDCFSAQQYYEDLENSGVDGIMVARGALIKPWIFTEIKEKREWDISSRERLDLIRNFAEFGLSHWGSDITGINTTRRFLCESLSFTCRYTPLGILEHVPAKINDRPEPFKGRDPLETLLSSGHASDWVKITEMFLGPCDADFKFVPKHKSSSGGGEEGNG